MAEIGPLNFKLSTCHSRILHGNMENVHDEQHLSGAMTHFLFDSHGGCSTATNFAAQHLPKAIINQKRFCSDNDEAVLCSITKGHVKTQKQMITDFCNWPRSRNGWPNTSGTSVSMVHIKNNKAYLSQLGDTGIIQGECNGGTAWLNCNTFGRHKVSCPEEKARILKEGGTILQKPDDGLEYITWNPPPATQPRFMVNNFMTTQSRGLGNMWSYNPITKKCLVSPIPDTYMCDLDPNTFKCFIVGSRTLFDILTPDEALGIVQNSTNFPSLNLIEAAAQKYRAQGESDINISTLVFVLEK